MFAEQLVFTTWLLSCMSVSLSLANEKKTNHHAFYSLVPKMKFQGIIYRLPTQLFLLMGTMNLV